MPSPAASLQREMRDEERDSMAPIRARGERECARERGEHATIKLIRESERESERGRERESKESCSI